MGSPSPWVIPLAEAADVAETQIGGKAAKLARLAQAGFAVPPGFCLSAAAYQYFIRENGLLNIIQMELARKPFDSMRWEEIWDAALRIRSAFLTKPIPQRLGKQIERALDGLAPDVPVAVRSSALGEDAAEGSFAGLHESVVGVTGREAILAAVRTVWASLWSDAALLYRQELSLDPADSRMAVLVQELIDRERSGVAFGRDPRDPRRERAIIEAVPGPCSDLVDGLVDPDHWELARDSGDVLEWRQGQRPGEEGTDPILSERDLRGVYLAMRGVESHFGWPPDLEWTGRAENLVLLQARPISTLPSQEDDERGWYLTLRPNMRRLRELRERVVNERIPQLVALGHKLASEPLDEHDDEALAAAIAHRLSEVEEWKRIYWDEFIPFAHGVRQLGIYYTDAVRPDDPYEFVGLLRGQRILAAQRNQALATLADQVRNHSPLAEAIDHIVSSGLVGTNGMQALDLNELGTVSSGQRFIDSFRALLDQHMDVAYDGQRLSDHPLAILQLILQMARSGPPSQQHGRDTPSGTTAAELEQRLLAAVGTARHEEAGEVLATARLSWRLRDDDNVLVGRIEAQLIRAVQVGIDRLRESGRLPGPAEASEDIASLVQQALGDESRAAVDLPEPQTSTPIRAQSHPGESPRQLVGQPAAPGLATGKVRRVRGPDDLGRFLAGEVLVCDAIQPTMTHLVPLACAVVERRGGMLIHGAIIARELFIPCVNGITEVMDLLHDGEVVTVDGYLGIVTVGPPEFELEGVRYRDGPM